MKPIWADIRSAGSGYIRPHNLGRKRANSGKYTIINIAMILAIMREIVHGMISSIDKLASLAATKMLDATGGVTCPMATFIVMMTPNHTGSHWKYLMSGSIMGVTTKYMDTPSMTMPITNKPTIKEERMTVGLSEIDIIAIVAWSIMPVVVAIKA